MKDFLWGRGPLLILVSLIVGACGTSEATVRDAQQPEETAIQSAKRNVVAGQNQGPSAGGAATLEARLTAAETELNTDVNPYGTDGEVAAIVERAKAFWRRRMQSCADDQCRRTVLSDQVNRLEYGFGRNQRPVAGMPWATGHLGVTISNGEASGWMRFYPLSPDQLLIVFVNVSMPSAQWICEMVAVGQLRPGPEVEMRSLDEVGQRFTFRPAGADQWSMESGPTKNRVCEAWGGVEGVYRLGEVDPAVTRALQNLAEQQLPDEMNRALEMLEPETRDQ